MTKLWRSGPLLLAVTMLCWSGSVIVGRAAADLVPPVLFAALRWATALLIVLPFAWPHLRADWAALWARRGVILVLALLGVVFYNILVYRGLHGTTAVNALLMQSAMPLLILPVSLVLYGERPRGAQVAAVIVSVVGVATIASHGSFDVLRRFAFNIGDGFVLVAVAAYAVYSAVLRRRPAAHPMSFLAATIGVGVVALVPLAAWEYTTGARMTSSPAAWLAVGYAGVFASFVATLFYNRGVELVGAARGGQYIHLMPVFGTLLAVLFLHEELHAYHGVGIALIAAGLLLASVQIRRPRLRPPSRAA